MSEQVIFMTSTKPYLIRALYEWINDNQLTPHIAVNAEIPGVQVPERYVEAGRIILNISPMATQGLELGNDWISFEARFDQIATRVLIPVIAVLAIYARENGRGMVFDEQYEASEQANQNGDEPPPPLSPPPKGKPKLVIVK